MKTHVRTLVILTLAALLSTAAQAQLLRGQAAQHSPQAEAFLTYEAALVAGGLDAAKPHMTPAKLDDLKSMVAAFGTDGFNQFLDRMRSGAQGEARRAQIEKIELTGQHAVLEARDGPNAVTVQHLASTADGWKVDVKP